MKIIDKRETHPTHTYTYTHTHTHTHKPRKEQGGQKPEIWLFIPEMNTSRKAME